MVEFLIGFIATIFVLFAAASSVWIAGYPVRWLPLGENDAYSFVRVLVGILILLFISVIVMMSNMLGGIVTGLLLN